MRRCPRCGTKLVRLHCNSMKWKKRIYKAIYKGWMSREQVSADDIIRWMTNPENLFELYQGTLNCFYNSPLNRFVLFIRE